MDDLLQLGGNIELAGFRSIDRSSFVIVKKIVGNYARKFSDSSSDFEKLQISLKSVHAGEEKSKYELHAMMINNGQAINAQETDHNLFFVLDRILKKLEVQQRALSENKKGI